MQINPENRIQLPKHFSLQANGDLCILQTSQSGINTKQSFKRTGQFIYCSIQSSNASYYSLNGIYQSLISTYYFLVGAYWSLRDTCQSLIGSYQRLIDTYQLLRRTSQSLIGTYRILRRAYHLLRGDFYFTKNKY